MLCEHGLRMRPTELRRAEIVDLANEGDGSGVRSTAEYREAKRERVRSMGASNDH